MPCKNCPENEKQAEGLRPDSKPLRPEPRPCKDSDELCKVWRSLVELDQARMYFRRHMDLMTCIRCKEWAVQIIMILDTYARMTTNAENYKIEKARLETQIRKMVEKIDSPSKQQEEEPKA